MKTIEVQVPCEKCKGSGNVSRKATPEDSRNWGTEIGELMEIPCPKCHGLKGYEKSYYIENWEEIMEGLRLPSK